MTRFRLPLSFAFLVACAALAAAPAAQTANPDRVFAIKDAKIVLGDGRTIEKGTVVLRRGLIEAVGETVEVPFDAETIDGSGLVVAPAFVDAFATIGVKDPDANSPNEAPGVDTTITVATAMPEALRRGLRPETSAVEGFNLDEAAGKPHREAGFGAAVLGRAGGILAGKSALALLAGAPRRTSLLRAPIAVHGAFRSSGGGYPSTKMGVLAVLRQAFLDAAHWKAEVAAYERKPGAVARPAHDEALAAIVRVLDRAIPLAIEADDADDIRRALDLAQEFGFSLWIVGGREAWKVADRLKEAEVPVVLGLDFGREPRKPGERPRAEGGESRPAGPDPKEDAEFESGAQQPAESKAPESRPGAEEGGDAPSGEDDDPKRVLEDRHRRWEEGVACAARLHEAGLRVVFATSGCRTPKEFLGNLEKAIGKGLPREAALAALTVAPAKLLGVESRLGTIEAGKIANLAVWKGEPLAKDAAVRYAFVDGRRFEVEAAKGTAASGSEKKEPPARGIDLTGTWEVATEGGRRMSGPMTLTLKQEGGTLTGQATGAAGTTNVAGTLSAKDVELGVEMSFGENTFTLRFVGTVESNSRMTGTIRGGGRPGGGGGGRGGGATWTATRKGPGADTKEGQ